jgi:hypothetical protein
MLLPASHCAAVVQRRGTGRLAPQRQFRYSHVLTDRAASSTSPLSQDSDTQRGAAAAPSPVGSWKVAGTLTACSFRLSSQGLLDAKRATISECLVSSLQNVNA